MGKNEVQNRQLFRKSLWEKQQGRCFYCHRLTRLIPSMPNTSNPPDMATLDHIIPRSKLKGVSYKENSVVACHECNNHKANMEIDEFRRMNYVNYLEWKERLSRGETVTRTVHGNSMTPRLHSGDTITLTPIDNPALIQVGDIVFCKVSGSFYVHLVTQKQYNKKQNRWRFLISNNHGHDNGWTHLVYGKVQK